MTNENIEKIWAALTDSQAKAGMFFSMHGFNTPECLPASAKAWWEAQSWDDVHDTFGSFDDFLERLDDFASQGNSTTDIRVESLELIGGTNKKGEREDVRLRFVPGEVVCLVGPTGAGKSRLLADIECLAQGDTPSHRQVLLNGEEPDEQTRFSIEHRLIAQITQNMNFVMDLPVAAFLKLHAHSRGIVETDEPVATVLKNAVELAGEPFYPQTPLTQLSGGQSRALMIADAAYLSPKPIVLIDEIENAGIDRQRALSHFVSQGKLVFLSTHDPLLALSGDRRLVIHGGGIHRVIQTSPEEKRGLASLIESDLKLSRLRACLRLGEHLY